MATHPTDLCVARADGRGAGRFLASSLLDALQAGTGAVSIRRTDRAPALADLGVEFIVCPESEETCEVIRAGVDASGTVVSAELLRRPKPSHGVRAVVVADLLSALSDAESVAGISFRPGSTARGPSLHLTVRRDRLVCIDL